jgi:hypothetical protein
MTSSNPADDVAYFVVVDGLDPEAQQITARHFQTKRAGARPEDLSLYVSVVTGLEQIDGCISWVTGTLPGRFRSVHVLVHIDSNLSWAEFTVPLQLLNAASRYGVEVRVLFAARPRTSTATTKTEA